MIVIRDRENDELAIYINENDSNWEDMLVELLNGQQATIDKQELRLQQLEELLELSENLNTKYREKLIDMNLKMVGLDAENEDLVKKVNELNRWHKEHYG